METEQLLRQFSLLKRIISPTDTAAEQVDLTALEKIIFERLPGELGENAPPSFPQLYFDFKREYERFREFILYDKLIGKNVVALGGGFSSGKSSFLNSLLGEKILPAKIDPSTSVPAYLVHDSETSVYGINAFHSRVKMELSDVKAISHGFGRLDDNDREATLGHILESIFISCPELPFAHIALLDTPGYSKAESMDYSAKTDEKIARSQLNSSNYILWFVQADAGTITEEDINFLSSLRKEIPKLIIVNKADKVLPEDLKHIVAKIRDVLDLKALPYLDVLTYSRKENVACDRKKILEQLYRWDRQVYESQFAYHFKVLFTQCQDYYNDGLDGENKRLSRLNKALTLTENNVVSDCLSSLISEIKRNITALKERKEALKQLQTEFFTELKRIGDQVHIELPEPSEIDLIRDKAADPKAVVDEYCAGRHLRHDPVYALLLTEALSGVTPVLMQGKGGPEYTAGLARLMEEVLPDSPEQIRFSFTGEMTGALAGVLAETVK